MPAATYEELFNMQANIEASFAAYFTANGLTAFHSRSSADLPDRRVIVMVEIGAANGHCMTKDKTGTQVQEQDMFAISIKAHVQSERTTGTASPVGAIPLYHDYLVSKVKKLFLRGAMNGLISGVTALASTYYMIPVFSYSGDNYDETPEGLDQTEITYTGTIQILESAWPVA